MTSTQTPATIDQQAADELIFDLIDELGLDGPDCSEERDGEIVYFFDCGTVAIVSIDPNDSSSLVVNVQNEED
jgi:hypothetical protein